MSDKKQEVLLAMQLDKEQFLVTPIEGRLGKLRLFVPGPDTYGLETNYGQLTEQELGTLLARKFSHSASEIENLLRRVKPDTAVN